jgi:hypothetical protein
VSRSEPSPATTASPRPDGRTLGAAAVGGVLASLVGYAVTYVLVGQRVSNSLAARVLEVATGDPGTWQLVGWVFYNAHNVTVAVPGLFGSTTINLVGGTFTAALLVLPPVALLAAGGGAAVLGGVDRPGAGAVAGLAVTIGYLPIVAVGAVLVGIDVGDSTAGPGVAAAVLIAGLVYPLVFGAVGGAIGGAVGDRR